MAYAKAIELNSDDVEYLQSLVRTRTIQAHYHWTYKLDEISSEDVL